MTLNEQIAKNIVDSLYKELEVFHLSEYDNRYVLSCFEFERLVLLTIMKNQLYMLLEVNKYTIIEDELIPYNEQKIIKYKDYLQKRIMSDKDYIMYNKALIEERI